MKKIAMLLALLAACSKHSSPTPTPPTVALPVPPPAAPDTRSDAEKADAACWGPNHVWACTGRAQPKTMMASTSGPLPPSPAMSILTWDVDPTNSTGCASNGNSCTSATCGASGVGPCLAVNKIVYHRWGTTGPTLQTGTTIAMLSAETLGQETLAPWPIAGTLTYTGAGATSAYANTTSGLGAPGQVPYGLSSQVKSGPAALVPVTTVYGAKCDGVTDDSGAIHNCAVATAGTGACCYLPQCASAYAIAHSIVLPNGSCIVGGGVGTVLQSSMAALDAHTNSVFTATNGLLGAFTSNTTVSTLAVVGSPTLHVTSGAAITNGQYIFVGDGTNYGASYRVVSGGTTTTITLDRPLLYPFVVTTPVFNLTTGGVASAPPMNITIRNLTIAGTGDRGIWIPYAWNTLYQDLTVNSSFTGFGLTFDLGGYGSHMRNVSINFVANTVIGASFESVEACSGENMIVKGGFTTGIQWGATASELNDSTVTGAAANGLACEETGVTDLWAARGDTIKGGSYSGNGTYGIKVQDGSQDLTFTGVYAQGNPYNIQVDNLENGTPNGISFVGGGSRYATTYGVQLLGVTGINFTGGFESRGDACGWHISTASYATLDGALSTDDGAAGTNPHVLIDGSSTAVVVGHLATDNAKLPSGGSILRVNDAGSSLWLRSSVLKSTGPSVQAVTTYGHLHADGVQFETAAGSTDFGIYAVTGEAIVDNWKQTGNAAANSYGFYVAGGGSATGRQGPGCDFTGAANPTYCGGGSYFSRKDVAGTEGHLVANGTTAVSVAWPLLRATDSVRFTLQTIGGTVGVPKYTITAGTGFAFTSAASDTSTYEWVIE